MFYDETNIFSQILQGKLPCYRLYEDEHTLAILDVMPRNPGHSLVLPKIHSRTLLDLPIDALGFLMQTVQKVARALKVVFSADGITIQQFNEKAGGQVIFHTHVHVIPRQEGVPLLPHTGQMEQQEILLQHASKIRNFFENQPQ